MTEVASDIHDVYIHVVDTGPFLNRLAKTEVRLAHIEALLARVEVLLARIAEAVGVVVETEDGGGPAVG